MSKVNRPSIVTTRSVEKKAIFWAVKYEVNRQLTILWLRCCNSLTAAESCLRASFGCCGCCGWWWWDEADDDGGCGCRTRLNGAYLHTRYMAASDQSHLAFSSVVSELSAVDCRPRQLPSSHYQHRSTIRSCMGAIATAERVSRPTDRHAQSLLDQPPITRGAEPPSTIKRCSRARTHYAPCIEGSLTLDASYGRRT